jgi:regulatory protein RepA
LTDQVVNKLRDIQENIWKRKIIKSAKDARLIIFDTLSRWHHIDENRNGDITIIISELESIINEIGSSILFLHHVSKSMAKKREENSQQSTRGHLH